MTWFKSGLIDLSAYSGGMEEKRSMYLLLTTLFCFYKMATFLYLLYLDRILCFTAFMIRRRLVCVHVCAHCGLRHRAAAARGEGSIRQTGRILLHQSSSIQDAAERDQANQSLHAFIGQREASMTSC